MKSIYICGTSGHGLVVAEIAMAYGYDDIIFIDDGNSKQPSFEDIKMAISSPMRRGWLELVNLSETQV